MTSDVDLRYAAAVRRMETLLDVGTTNAPVEVDFRWPDFLIIGAQKAGTTWLHRNLDYHPLVWFPPIKEVNFFSEKYVPNASRWEYLARKSQVELVRSYYERLIENSGPYRDIYRIDGKIKALDMLTAEEISDKWYGKIFSFAGPHMIAGESSPDYAVLPRAAIANIVRNNPAIKIILFVRDPIDRLWSHVKMAQASGDLPEGTENLIRHLDDRNNWRIFDGRSNYPAIINNWFAYVPPQNVLVKSFDDISQSPLAAIESVCNFLNIPFDRDFFSSYGDKVGEGKKMDIDPEVYSLAKERMKYIYENFVQMYPGIVAPWISRHYF